MKMLPKGVVEYNHAVTRLLIWSIPLLFSVPSPYHGLQVDTFLFMPGPWVVAALIGLFRNPQRDAKIFYAGWLFGLAGLEVWYMFFVPQFAR
jgi:hypothetical protein